LAILLAPNLCERACTICSVKRTSDNQPRVLKSSKTSVICSKLSSSSR
jgi:hypothetical protein